MAKRGRPRGLNINPAALDDWLDARCMSKAELCEAAGITPGHLADMLYRDKGAKPETVRAMAAALRCQPETIAPTLNPAFVYVRGHDLEAAAS